MLFSQMHEPFVHKIMKFLHQFTEPYELSVTKIVKILHLSCTKTLINPSFDRGVWDAFFPNSRIVRKSERSIFGSAEDQYSFHSFLIRSAERIPPFPHQSVFFKYSLPIINTPTSATTCSPHPHIYPQIWSFGRTFRNSRIFWEANDPYSFLRFFYFKNECFSAKIQPFHPSGAYAAASESFALWSDQQSQRI